MFLPVCQLYFNGQSFNIQTCTTCDYLTLLIIVSGKLFVFSDRADPGSYLPFVSNKTAADQYGVGHVLHTTLESEITCTSIIFQRLTDNSKFLFVSEIVVMGRKLSGIT